MSAQAWQKSTHTRGVRLVKVHRSGFTVSELRDFLRKVDEAGLSENLEVNFRQGDLREGGSRTYELTASEAYEPEVSGA